MKLKNILCHLAIIVLLSSQLWAANTNPVVTNVTFSLSGSTVTVHYDVADEEQSTVTISMKVSSDGGNTWDYDFGTATGDTGVVTGVSAVAAHKTIYWTYSGVGNSNFEIMIVANDESAGGSPCPGIATVDYSGMTYNTIQIGNQCWLKENLDVGTQIDGTVEQTDNNIIEKYCFEDDPANCTTYGGLYEWNEAMQYINTEGAQGICPTDWHIPTYTELQTLAPIMSDSSGNALKETGQGTGEGIGTNTSGFSALLSGYHHQGEFGFYDLNISTDFWSSTMYDESDGKYMYLLSYNNTINPDHNAKAYGYSVRCIKN